MRSGFTLIEALVALVLFEIGILALVSSSAVAARDLAIANRRTHARQVATVRVERLRASACAGAADGTLVLDGGLTEKWRTTSAGAARTVSDSVDYLLPAGRRSSIVVRASVWCGQ